MTVYVDALTQWGWKLGASCHLVADTEEELHAFAAMLGLKRTWFQTGTLLHYDLTERRRVEALRLGAVEISRREIAERIRARRASMAQEPPAGFARPQGPPTKEQAARALREAHRCRCPTCAGLPPAPLERAEQPDADDRDGEQHT